MGRKLIQGGLVITPDGAVRADILIEGERIAGLLENAGDLAADERIDATGLVVLPGAVDGHTHFQQDDPAVANGNSVESEGFTNGGAAAAAGGITTVVEMPQSTPASTDGKTFRRKAELAGHEAIVDFALWGGVCAGQAPEGIEEQVEAGAVGFKAFMCGSEPGFPGIDDAQLLTTLQILQDTGLMLGVHAENDAMLQAGIARMRRAGRKDALAHAESRPPVVEVEAVNRAIFFAEETGAWIHIVHMSAPGAAELVGQAKDRGLRVTAETCPQYLALDLDDLARLGPYAKCAPAVRDRPLVEDLWEYVADGTIDCITSDHCGYAIESKEAGRTDIWNAPNGLSGVQTMLPVFITEARHRGLSWEEIAYLTATEPAELWKLAPRKGAIRIGADADLALVDPDREWTISTGDLLHTHKWTPFEGRQVKARVVRTILRGETIYNDTASDRVTVSPGFGRFILPQSRG